MFSSNLRLLLVLLLSGQLLAGCVSSPQHVAWQSENHALHERISTIILKKGYSHQLLSIRNVNGIDEDYITVSLPLDGLLRQDRSIDQMLKEIGILIRSETYRNIPISVRFFCNHPDAADYIDQSLRLTLGDKRSLLIFEDKADDELLSRLVFFFKSSRQ